ncbi:hypothetical protein VCSRO187_1008 [Vibrio cholerae]|nr:hypothetical protein VCSRO187_1008 [Vibrio cholerae]
MSVSYVKIKYLDAIQNNVGDSHRQYKITHISFVV